MDLCFLRILSLLDSDGYFARTKYEKDIMNDLSKKGFVEVKPNTKKCYIITDIGISYLNRTLNPNKDVSDEEFLKYLKNAYFNLYNPMNPLIKIPTIRKNVTEQLEISDALFNKKVLALHDIGAITLQTALAAPSATDGIPCNHGIFYYLTVE